MRCEDCKYWETTDRYMKKSGLGFCNKTPEAWRAYGWLGEDKKDIRFENVTAFVQDGSDYSASLYTMPDHYCSMWCKK